MLMFRGVPRHISLITGLILVVFAEMCSAAQGGQCSNASLNGPYGINFQGVSTPLGAFMSVSLLTFDGKGNFSASEAFNSQQTGPQTRTVSGTYTIQPNCSFTLSEQNNTTGQHAADAMCVLVDNGKQFYCVDFEPGWQLLGIGTRI